MNFKKIVRKVMKKNEKIPHYSKKICIFAAEFFNKLTIILL